MYHALQTFGKIHPNIKSTRKVYIIMEGKIKQNTVQTSPAKPCRTKIIIERHYGEGNLLDLFSDYVAGKIQSRIKETTKLKDEITA